MNGTNGLPVDKVCHKKKKPMLDVMIGYLHCHLQATENCPDVPTCHHDNTVVSHYSCVVFVNQWALYKIDRVTTDHSLHSQKYESPKLFYSPAQALNNLASDHTMTNQRALASVTKIQ